jgi:hypothetical protein
MSNGIKIINDSDQVLISDTYRGLALKGVFTPQTYGPNTYVDSSAIKRSTMTVITGLPYTGTEMIFVYSADGSPVSVDTAWPADNSVFMNAGFQQIDSTTIDINLAQWTRYKPQPQAGMDLSLFGGAYFLVGSVSWNVQPFFTSRVRLTCPNGYTVGNDTSLFFRSNTFTGSLVVTIGTNGIQNDPNNYKVLVFDTVTNTPSSGYGLKVSDSLGNTTFDTSKKMLTVAAVGVVPTLPNNTVVSLSSLQSGYSVAPLFGVIPTTPAFLNNTLARHVSYSNQGDGNPYGGAVQYGVSYNRVGANFAPVHTGTTGSAISNSSSSGTNDTIFSYGYGGSTYVMAIDASLYI